MSRAGRRAVVTGSVATESVATGSVGAAVATGSGAFDTISTRRDCASTAPPGASTALRIHARIRLSSDIEPPIASIGGKEVRDGSSPARCLELPCRHRQYPEGTDAVVF